MMLHRILLLPLLFLLLGGCARPEDPRLPLLPEAALTPCPGPGRAPAPPRGLKSPESIARFATQLDAALTRAEAARAACSRRVAQLEAWIGRDTPHP